MSKEDSRWYSEAGAIVDTVPLKNPVKEKAPDGTEYIRKTTRATLAHAKKMALLPSVTTVCELLHSVSLFDYLIEHAIRQTALYPFVGNKDVEEEVAGYVSMIRAKASEHAEDAAESGKVFHAALYNHLFSNVVTANPILLRACEKVSEHLAAAGVTNGKGETALVSKKLGYAGTPDYVGTAQGSLYIMDFKTVDGVKFKAPYDKWKLQLGAYENLAREAEGHQEGCDATLMQAVICRNTGDVTFFPHAKGVWGRAFTGIFETWMAIKNYDPRSK